MPPPGRICVITGAGISAESGVPTFRGADGLWRRYRAEDLATPEAFAANPLLVWEWYAWRRSVVGACQPNPAHEALARLEQSSPDFLLVTQNVDGLHERAGSKRIETIHGSLWAARCPEDGRVWPDTTVKAEELPPRCSACGSVARPNVLWFGEAYDPDQVARVAGFLRTASLVLVVGTSGAVWLPVELAYRAHESGARVVEFNVEETSISRFADEVVRGPAAETLPAYVENLLAPV